MVRHLWLPIGDKGIFLIVLQCWIGAGDWTSVLDHGSVLGFPSYDEANKLLDGWLRSYPQIFSRHDIGKSFEGRTIYAYCLTSGVDRLYSKRHQVLLTALMHAREPTSLTVLLYFLGHVMELHQQGNAEAMYIVQTKELWVVPFVNPDGYLANAKIPGTGRRKVIRKNLRPTCRDKLNSGVDINRNFAFHWSKDFSPCNEEFQGSQPFSEPETQALKKLIDQHEFKAAVNFHSFGGMLTHPFNWGRQPLPQDDQRVYDEIAKVFKWPKFGPAIKTVGYTAPGESDDWMYGAKHIISMSPEVGPENGDFWPPSSLVKGIDSRNFLRTSYVVKKAGLELEAIATHNPAKTIGVPPQINERLKRAGGEPASVLRLTLKNKGLGTSTGEVLQLALAGNARSHADHFPNGVVLLQGDGVDAPEKPASLFFQLGNAPPILSFQISPVARRSEVKLQIYLAAAFDSVEDRDKLQLCAAEMPKADIQLPADAPVVCQCLVFGKLPAGTSPQTASTAQIASATLTNYRDLRASSEMEKLCNAAVTQGNKGSNTPEPPICCQAVTAQCLACTQGISVAAYCTSNPLTPGCSKAVDYGCCYSFGFGAYMKPCCLKTQMYIRKEDCKNATTGGGPKIVGGATGWNPTCPLTADVAAQLLNVQVPVARSTAAPQASWVGSSTTSSSAGPTTLTTRTQRKEGSGWTLFAIVSVVAVIATCLLAQVILRRRRNGRQISGDEESVPATKIPTHADRDNVPID